MAELKEIASENGQAGGHREQGYPMPEVFSYWRERRKPSTRNAHTRFSAPAAPPLKGPSRRTADIGIFLSPKTNNQCGTTYSATARNSARNN